MNVLFLSLYRISNINNKGIYEDLLREFVKHNHDVYIVTPVERKLGIDTILEEENKCHLLSVKTGNIQKTNVFEKGISTILLEHQFIFAIKMFLSNVKFDLVLYSTPPITLAGVVEYVKKRDNAKTYLMLKDIFPQNAVDIGMLSKTGVKGFFYKYFRYKEKKLYRISDSIGCMSQANVEYVLKHNPEISKDKLEVCPNCIDPIDITLSNEERIEIRQKYGIPLDKKIFVYGGNLGKPQGIPFLIECIRSQKGNKDVCFFIVGNGTEYKRIEKFLKEEKQENLMLMKTLPREDYDRMIAACDVGMIFLDYRFTIPNFPSRLLSYMQAGLPVLACTDNHSDIGKLIVDADFGWWCRSDTSKGFVEIVNNINEIELQMKSQKAKEYLNREFTTKNIYKILCKE